MRKGWRRSTLCEAVEVTMGRQRSPKHVAGDHVLPYLRAANVKDGRLELDSVLKMNFSPVEQVTFSLQPGDVLVTEGCGSIGQLGAAARWGGEIDGVVCFQNTLLRLRAVEGLTDPGFVDVWARHAFSSGLFAAVASGTNIFHIGSTRAKQIPLLLPPLAEQRRMVDLTVSVDQLASAARQQTQLSEVALTEVREGLLRSEAAPSMPLSSLVLRIEGGRSPVTSGRLAEYGERGVLKLSAVRPGCFVAGETKALEDSTPMPDTALVKVGDVLITRSNTNATVGAVCHVELVWPSTYLSDLTLRLVVRRSLVDPRYLVEALLSRDSRGQIEGAARGTSGSMRKISRELINQYTVPVPDLAEQKRIVDLLSDVRGVARRSAAVATRAEEFRTRLVADLLSGDHEIPDSYDALLEPAS